MTTWREMCDSIEESVRLDVEHGNLDLTDEDWCEQYAHEFADGSEWTIYTNKTHELWWACNEVSDREDEAREYAYDSDGVTIMGLMRSCVYLALRDAVSDAIARVRSESDDDN